VKHLPSVRNEIRTLQGDGKGKALCAITGGAFVVIGVQMLYPALLPEMRVAYGFDLSTAGLLLTLLWFMYAVGQLPGGILSDRVGEETILVVSTLLTATMIVVILAVRSTLALFVVTPLFGFGVALYGVARLTALHDMYPDQVGIAFGIVHAGVDAGQALLPAVGAFLAASVAWQYGFAFTLPLFALIAVGIWLYIPKRTSGTSSGVDSLSTTSMIAILRRLRTTTIGFSGLAFLLPAVIWTSFTSFYPTYLVEIKGISSNVAGLLFGSFFAVGVVWKPIFGSAYDRWGLGPPLALLSVISATGLAMLPFTDGTVSIAVVTLLVSTILGGIPIAQSNLVNELPADIKGTALGIVRTIVISIAAASPVVFGLSAERGYFDEGFLVLAVVAASISLLAVRIHRI
jgi:MFS family permease